MVARRPLVLVAGRKKELPVGDTISWSLLSDVPQYTDAWGAISPASKADTASSFLLRGVIPASADLNSYTETGIFHQPSNANAASGANYPVSLAGELTVYTEGAMTYQTYRRYGAVLAIFHRNFYNGTWYAWSNDWNSANFDPAGKANVVHGHAIGEVAGLQTSLDERIAAGTAFADAFSSLPTYYPPSSSFDANSLMPGQKALVSTTGNTNLPVVSGIIFWYIECKNTYQAGGPQRFQIAHSYSNAPAMCIRNLQGGNWQPWRRLATENDLGNIPTQTGDLLVSKASAIVGVGVSGGRNGGLANYANDGIGDVGLFSDYAGGRIRLRPDGRLSSTGELQATTTGFTWNGNVGYHAGNHGSSGDPHAQYVKNTTTESVAGLKTFSDLATFSSGIRITQLQSRIYTEGGAQLDIDNVPSAADGVSQVRFNRSVTTTGAVYLGVHNGDGTSGLGARFGGNGVVSSFVCNNGGNFGIGTQTPALAKLQVNGDYAPHADNMFSSGLASRRHSVVWAGTSAISTSDARHKTSLRPFTPQEISAAIALGDEFGVYRWLDAIDAKGEGDARLHPGMTVQRAIEVMAAHGLDPMRYGFICYDEWPEQPEIRNCWPFQPRVVDDFGDLVREQVDAGVEVVQEYRAAGDLYSFRMALLLAFIAAGERAARLAALANLEMRLAALELQQSGGVEPQ